MAICIIAASSATFRVFAIKHLLAVYGGLIEETRVSLGGCQRAKRVRRGCLDWVYGRRGAPWSLLQSAIQELFDL